MNICRAKELDLEISSENLLYMMHCSSMQRRMLEYVVPFKWYIFTVDSMIGTSDPRIK
jgi:hypothetical protein